MVTAGPGMLKVESAGDSIHVHHFTCKVQALAAATFHGLELNILQKHATTGDEFIFVGALANHLKLGLSQLSG